MQSAVIEFNKKLREQSYGDMNLRSGDVVKVHRKIKEGAKERTQIFEGMIIAIKGGQSSSRMITVRKVSAGSYGVEIVVPVNSPMIEKIELVKRAKVRRSKLYYVRDKASKALRFKFTDAKDVKMPANSKLEVAESSNADEDVEVGKQEVESTDAPDTKAQAPAEKEAPAQEATDKAEVKGDDAKPKA